ncbi:MAG: 2-(1,2-epoxy-1,2-dihydrophenyl)acetyl-CoA isomerase [Deltaproteobacteria bacterium]|jgi:2-(1,2-epoxy-1,2-dihydrophenyl)acetyl-CoA isomerase|nr:2-(1,2-epoxy-1,2-dihydrophenyl)acetyl-CoA isomerase [Deltaproteobacteria bacterium]
MDFGSYAGFEIEKHTPGIALFSFNQPDRLNGMSAAIKRDLIEALLQAQMDDAVRVLVITGQGRAFCAGDDLKAYPTHDGGPGRRMPLLPAGHHTAIGTYDGLRAVSQALNRAVRELDKLTVAAINGIAIQTGLSLALACDFRIASEAARLGSATLRFALLPDEGGHHLLVQYLGVGRALDFVMRKRIASAAEALELGLVNEVVAPEELLPRSLELAGELARGPQVAMRLLKRSVYNAAEVAFGPACEDIAARTAVSDHHPDAREGVMAWREKREPSFNQDLPE